MSLGVILSLVTIVLLSLQDSSQESLWTSSTFTESDLTFESTDIVDVGVVDIEANDNFDIFTVNLNQQRWLLSVNASRHCEEQVTTYFVDQTTDFRDIELNTDEPKIKDGLNIYWQNEQ